MTQQIVRQIKTSLLFSPELAVWILTSSFIGLIIELLLCVMFLTAFDNHPSLPDLVSVCDFSKLNWLFLWRSPKPTHWFEMLFHTACSGIVFLTVNHSEYLGPFIKDIHTKSRKIDPPPSLSALAEPPLPPCPYKHTINFEISEVFCTKKCGRPHLKTPSPRLPLGRKMSALDKLPLTA